MMNLTQKLDRHLVLGLMAGYCFAALLAIASPTIAAYKPPPQTSRPTKGTTITTGTRSPGSSPEKSDIGLILLVPYTHVGQTTASHPTFAWFVPNVPLAAIEFRLFTLTQQPLYSYKVIEPMPAGVMQATLPPDQPGLEIGQRYRWQVALTCKSSPASTTTISAEIERVALPPNLAAQLAANQNLSQQVQLYAEAGLWYDALAAALLPDQALPKTTSFGLPSAQRAQGSTSLLNLLDDLARSEADQAKDWSDRLRLIRAGEQQRL